MTNEQTIADLRHQVAERDARIAVLETELSRLRPPPLPPPQRDGPFQLPSVAQCEALWRVVTRRYPQLIHPRIEQAEAVEEMRASLRYLGAGDCMIVDAPDVRHAPSHWPDAASAFTNTIIRLPPFTTAIVGSGAIPFTALDRHPHDIAFGLVEGRRFGSRKLQNQWLDVLRDGRLLEPVPRPRDRQW